MAVIVAKLGGSLLDLPDLRTRLQRWRAQQPSPVWFVPGGGAMADLIRAAQPLHGLSDAVAHDVAIRTMTLNAHLVSAITGWPVTAEPPEETGIADVQPWCATEPLLPATWQVTSDSIALRLAQRHHAELILLKSTALPEGSSWRMAAQHGLIDDWFPTLWAMHEPRVAVRWVNLRAL